ncbi:MAG: Rieske 2Fe-2S domain-containing protein [Bacillaceae bacterium]|nr:Rieske 2Fe-2S domain-containing protein [Bacillaceae bacterium]
MGKQDGKKSLLESLGDEKWNRRKFLMKSVKGLSGLMMAGAGLPFILSACSPRKTETTVSTESMIDLGPVEKIKKGPFPLRIDYDTTIKDGWADIPMKGFVYVTPDKQGDLMIMSPICTHLGCTVPEASPEQKKKGIAFHCPCHGGDYDEQGNNIGGPPPRPLDVFQPYIRDGHVFIQMLNPVKREG